MSDPTPTANDAAADDTKPLDPVETVPAQHPPAHRRIDRRSALLGAGSVAALLAAFALGWVTSDRGDHRDRLDGGRFERAGGGPGMQFRAERGGMDGPRGGRMFGGGGPGEMQGRGVRQRSGPMGVVTSRSGNTVKVAPIGGPDASETVTVTVTKDTAILTRDSDGTTDKASIDDVDENDVILVRADDSEDENADADAVTADKLVILHNAGE